MAKGSQNRQRLTLAAALRRCPVLLAGNGTARKLATLKHARLFGRFQLRCSARFEGAEDQDLSNGNGNGNGNGKSKSQSQSEKPVLWLLLALANPP
ncbi:hypothetical protein [Pseudoxanthomonas sp. GM95]|uniref:hypothetical protein n=1 Tax=Pseudoxanthomonas sp. GM95 TaxID=1881043 RepID=UPI001587BEBA|nr:hypothetical protein [Pseudoxanthomonas sp. GM95]